MEIFAVDIANSNVKMCFGDGKTDVYLNTCRELTPFENEFLGNAMTIYEYEQKRYVVGEKDAVSSAGYSLDKYNDQYKRETLFAIAKHVENYSEIHLVTGLPAEHFKRTATKEQVKNMFIGSHLVLVNGVEKRFDIKVTTVLLQPLGSALAFCMNEDGEFVKEKKEQLNGKTLIVDVGFGTLDYVMLENMNNKGFGGADLGILSAINKLETFILNEYNDIEGLPSGLELNEKVQEADTIRCGGVEYQIAHIKDHVFKDLVSEIIRTMDKKGYVIQRFDKVIFTGGGTMMLKKYLKPYVEGRNASILGNSQIGNVLGYYRYGKRKGC